MYILPAWCILPRKLVSSTGVVVPLELGIHYLLILIKGEGKVGLIVSPNGST
jgi:hypothetical protein